jgi:hypothetical protein
MAEGVGHTATGKPARGAESEQRDKGRDQRDLDERAGKPDDGTSNHPESKRSGRKGESNVGEDQSSGGE